MLHLFIYFTLHLASCHNFFHSFFFFRLLISSICCPLAMMLIYLVNTRYTTIHYFGKILERKAPTQYNSQFIPFIFFPLCARALSAHYVLCCSKYLRRCLLPFVCLFWCNFDWLNAHGISCRVRHRKSTAQSCKCLHRRMKWWLNRRWCAQTYRSHKPRFRILHFVAFYRKKKHYDFYSWVILKPIFTRQWS